MFLIQAWPVTLAAAVLAILPPAPGRRDSGPVWPNAESRANSDPWIAANHDRIREMRPSVLVLNFVNGLSPAGARAQAERLAALLEEGSRYHGHADPAASAFLRYRVFKVVDLTDPGHGRGRPLANSSAYPRVAGWDGGDFGNFRYAELFGGRFARRYGVADPDRPGAWLDLKGLVDRGIVHEVWMVCIHEKTGGPFESTEVKQAYDERSAKVPGRWVQAGNGGSPDQPFIGRSLRIAFLNAERGPGCALESLSHSMEGMASSGAIPYFTRYFNEYAGFDLKERYGLPFRSLYGREPGTEVSYPAPTTLRYSWGGSSRTLDGYRPAGGNVHFMPSGRRDYDLDNPATVLSTAEHFRLGDGADGRDRAEPWTGERFARFRECAGDCMGPWLVYWRQNMPGLDNPARDDQGKPMKNWWPFLFY
ncbi:hypothetical protein OJF2_07610 [Aquisphaera giovannonii]|uniref:Uncharacterized protein n=2 Tax=Aquisphaera giovannonii TaxID=406548 RepID=A0A5B9VVM5_9BACT|nr:hypothetical protein OJF2_07610 [Aquisphaera giovannonii]